MSTVVFYSLSTVSQYFIEYLLLVLCHYVHYCPLYSVQWLLLPHTKLSVDSLPLYPLLSSTVSPLSVRNTVSSLRSVSLRSLLSSTVWPMVVSTSHCTVCWFWVPHNVTSVGPESQCPCCLLQSVHCLSLPYTVQSVYCLSVPNTVRSVVYVSQRRMLSSTISPLLVRTSPWDSEHFLSITHCTVNWFCFTMSTTVFYILFTAYQYLSLYRLLFLCHYVHCCLLDSVTLPDSTSQCTVVSSVSVYPLLSSRVCPMPASTSHCTVCPLSVSTTQCTFCCFWYTICTAVF